MFLRTWTQSAHLARPEVISWRIGWQQARITCKTCLWESVNCLDLKHAVAAGADSQKCEAKKQKICRGLTGISRDSLHCQRRCQAALGRWIVTDSTHGDLLKINGNVGTRLQPSWSFDPTAPSTSGPQRCDTSRVFRSQPPWCHEKTNRFQAPNLLPEGEKKLQLNWQSAHVANVLCCVGRVCFIIWDL